ncbi:hypothetical protein FGL83_00485 [Leuconostoc lactis]|uniref:Uncharacterized protein n=1 Tax=Leuconostoc lactis TaxID=1246 RepID=A0AAP9EAJ2_LEULA|nr:hypothetical protein [Leuconostoc lactis]QEA43272.1 hypothetical protein FGL83_00485 [Leuconostoc lactis]
MVKIAGIESRDQISGRLIQATPVEKNSLNSHVRLTEYDGIIRPDEELYTRDQVIEILKRYDFFKNSYNEIDEEDGGELAMWNAHDALKHRYTGSQWSGIDEFIRSEIG